MKIKNKKKQLKNKTENKTDLISIVLLCDSPGYRMKSYGPLSLIHINTSKLIDLQISAIKQAFKNFELIVCLGFDSEKVCRYIRTKYSSLNVRVIENQIYNSSNSCESLRLSLNNICNNKILICDGNLLINHKSLKLLHTDRSCTLFEKTPCQTLEIGLNIDSSKEAQFFSFGAKNTWSEIIFLNGKDVIESLRRIIVNYESKNRFVFEAINEIINLNFNIECIANDYKITKINNIKTYHALKDGIHESTNI